MLMSAADYRESLRRYRPRVFVNGQRVESVADEPLLAPGIAAVGVTYDFALKEQHLPLMTARQGTSGKTVNRMLHIDETSTDLLYKLEAVRLVCCESGCAQRYLSHDGLNAIFQATKRIDANARHRRPRPLPQLSPPRPGRGPDARRRHDRRQGRPLAAAGRAVQSRRLCPHIGAAAGRHRHPRHQGDRHRRAVHARIARHALPHA